MYNRLGANLRWEPLPYGHLKELCQTAEEFGRDLPYFKSLMHATFVTNVLVPHDIKTVMDTLLTLAQFWIWEQSWKRQLEELLEIYKTDHLRAYLTMGHLCGEGDF